ncbi:unnamed protein product [Heterobilharzia americana]|nr:unnamed protein product [Heterobilharzia americana]
MVIRSMLIGLLCLSITGIIFMWFTSNKSVSQCSLVDAICKDVYFRQCTRSRDLWLECIGKLNRLSKQQSPYLRELKSTWPPATITDLIDNQLPIINLALHIPFDKNAENPLNNKYYHEYLNLISNKSVHRDRNTWLSIFHGGMTEVGFSASNYALFPQTLNFQKVIHEVENGIPVKTLPINNPELLVLRLPKNVCNPCQKGITPDLVIIIKSCSYCSRKRSRARETFMQKHLWSGINVQFVFVLGIPYPGESNTVIFDRYRLSHKKVWWRLSKMHDNERWTLIKRLVKEADLHEDLLIGSFHDTYFNLTTKLILTLRWLSVFCEQQVPLFVFIDDDYDLVPVNVIKFYRNHTKNHLRRMTGGCVHGSSVVERPKSIDTISGIWALSFKEFPWKTFPPYFHGASYILGSNIVRHLAIVSAFTQSIHIDDAYLGILMNKLNIPPQHLNIFPLVAGKCDILSGAICVRSDISKRIMNWKTGMLK